MSNPFKRPSRGESQEDLMALEKEFFQNMQRGSNPPAAKVIKRATKNQNQSGNHPTISEQLENEINNGVPTPMEVEAENDDSENKHSTADSNIEYVNESVLFSIRERVTDVSKLQAFSGRRTLPVVSPVVTIKDNIEEPTGKKKGKSLFARSFDAMYGVKNDSAESLKPTVNEDNTTVPIGSHIHPILDGMSEKEIMEEQRRLMEKLDPKMIEFVKSMKKKREVSSSTDLKSEASGASTTSKTCMNNDVGMETLKKESPVSIQETDLPILPSLVVGIPGMEKVELEKLEWTGVIKESSVNDSATSTNSNNESNLVSASKEKNARFDFEGNLVPDTVGLDRSTFDKGLHNHGEEMEKPGYTLEELLILGRSTNPQQKALSMNTMAHIFEKAHTGIYDRPFDKSLFQVVDYMDFIYLIRKGLDQSEATTLNASFMCLASILYSTHEEACLDVVYLWPEAEPHPWISTTPDAFEQSVDPELSEKEMKDFEILQIDLLEFLVQRSQILTRISYIFKEKSEILTEAGIQSILKILIRIARHSPNELISCESLIQYLLDHHISANWTLVGTKPPSLKGVPLPSALKVIRILANSSAENSIKLFKNFNIFSSIISYMVYDDWNNQTHVIEVENLILESFKTWHAFLHYGIALEHYSLFFPVLMKFLRFYQVCDTYSAFELGHAAHLFTMLQSVSQNLSNSKDGDPNFKSPYWQLLEDGVSFVQEFAQKMFSILASSHLDDTYNFDLALLALGQSLRFLISISKFQEETERAHPGIMSAAQKFLLSSNFSKITSALSKHSVLLCQIPTNEKVYPSNFATVGASFLGGMCNPVISSGSPFHFLTVFLQFLQTMGKGPFDSYLNASIEKYITKLEKVSSLGDHTDYFVRFELSFVYELLEIYPKAQQRFYIAYKVLAEVPSCCKVLYEKLLKLALVSCSCGNDNDVSAAWDLYSAYLVKFEAYQKVSEVKESNDGKKVRFDESAISKSESDGNGNKSSISFCKWSSKMAQPYWVFEPLSQMYKNASKYRSYLKDHLSRIEKESRICLGFVKVCLENFRDSLIRNSQDFTSFYCQICSIFMLGHTHIYFDEVNTTLLKDILKLLIECPVVKAHKGPIFSTQKPINGFSSTFYDFYNELIKEYQDNSYFNDVFGAYVLLPLMAGEDSRMKRSFWTLEYLKSIRTSSENFVLPMDLFTTEEESDPEIINLFWKLVHSKVIDKSRNPLLFEILKFHLTAAAKGSGEFQEKFAKLKL